ncbi:hypothetical protein BGZ52_008512, partial [Haplosporangium bisporale]
SNYTNPSGYQPTTQYQPSLHSKRSMERGDRRAQENHGTSEPTSFDKEPELASSFNPNASFASTISTSDYRPAQHEQQQPHHHQQPHPPSRHPHHHHHEQLHSGAPLTPSSNYDTEYDLSKNDIRIDESGPYPNYDHGPYPSQPENEDPRQDYYDADVATRSQGSTVERDARMPAPRSDSTPALNGHGPRVGPNGAPVPAHLMPHPPPRSPRREHRNDQPGSPHASDNEDDGYQAQQVPRRRTPTTPRLGATREYVPDQNYPLSPTGDFDLRDGQVSSASKVSMKPNYDPSREPEHYQPVTTYTPATPSTPASSKQNHQPSSSSSTPRKNVSGHIQPIPSNLSLNVQVSQDLNPASPINNGSSQSTPASPIANIIDQDAEKFRSFMNKMNSPTRKVTSPSNDAPDTASAIGQAVAMETIQQQIELHNQFMSQNQGQGQGPSNRANNGYGHHGHDQRGPHENGVSINVHAGHDGNYQEEGRHYPDRNANQLSLPSEGRDRRRESTMQMYDNYPKIATRSTSHHRDADDSRDFIPQPPKRYDSQPSVEQVSSSESARPARSVSPTPSGNSSLANATSNSTQSSSSHSRPGPTSYQQKLSMFGDHLELMSVLVVGSNIRTNDKGKEILTFLVSVGHQVRENENSYPHRESDEQWRVEKQYTDFVNLDSRLRITQSRSIVNSLPRLPDKGLFSTHAPSKSDARKLALEQYIQQVTCLRIKDTRDLCEFLGTNITERERRREGQEGWKEGYLTKRGKNFGGWKTRYFVLRGPSLEYFDMKDGNHLGSISLTNAQIGRQQSQEKSNDVNDSKEGIDPNSYRHAFLILEPKKGQTVADARKNPNNVMRHVLCAETDEDRDQWVESLLLHVGKEDPNEQQEKEKEREKEKDKSGRKMPEIQKVGATPIKELASVKGNEKLLLNQEAYERQQRSIPPSPSAQQFPPQARNGMPMSPTMAGMNMDDRSSIERQGDPSANRHPPYNQGHWNGEQDQGQRHGHPHPQQYQGQHQYQGGPGPQQQPQPPQQMTRNQSSHSLNQEEAVLKPATESQPQIPQMSKEEIAEKKQRSRMTFHWPTKKAAKEESPAQAANGAQSQSSGSAPGGLRNFLGGGKQSSSSQSGQGQGSNQGSGAQPPLAPIRQVFGVSLEQAVDQARVQPGYELPAVVYRCIEYLNYHKAKLEEA